MSFEMLPRAFQTASKHRFHTESIQSPFKTPEYVKTQEKKMSLAAVVPITELTKWELRYQPRSGKSRTEVDRCRRTAGFWSRSRKQQQFCLGVASHKCLVLQTDRGHLRSKLSNAKLCLSRYQLLIYFVVGTRICDEPAWTQPGLHWGY